MSISERLSPLIGRWMLAWFFLAEVRYYGENWHGAIVQLYGHGIHAAPMLLVAAMILLILGSLSLLLGFFTRQGAVMLFAVTLVAAVSMHPYWMYADAVDSLGHNDRIDIMQLFFRDVAIAGGLLLLVGMGSGSMAIDNLLNKKKK